MNPGQTVEERIEANTREVDAAIDSARGPALRKLLERSETDLAKRLREAHAAGLGDRWTGAQLQATRLMIAQAIARTTERVKGLLEDHSTVLSSRGITDAVGTLKALEATHTGTTRVLALDDALQLDHVTRGVRSSLLRQQATSVDRYGVRMIGEFERTMQIGLVQGVDVHTMMRRLVGEHGGPRGIVSTSATVLPDGSVKRLTETEAPAGLFRQNAYWAERIVRTELLYAYNSGTQAALEKEEEDFPDLKRIILAHFDRRTGEDSIYVHGQIRDLREPFTDGAGRVYLHPPARPNDRERVIPWRLAWGYPEGKLAPRPKEERAEAAKEAGGEAMSGVLQKDLEAQTSREAHEKEVAKAQRAMLEDRASQARDRLLAKQADRTTRKRKAAAEPPPSPAALEAKPPPAPIPALELGKHVKRMTGPAAARLAPALLGDAELLAFLERFPLADLEVKAMSLGTGGAYYGGLEKVKMNSIQAGRIAKAFAPGQIFTIAEASLTREEEMRRMLIHELGHHINMAGLDMKTPGVNPRNPATWPPGAKEAEETIVAAWRSRGRGHVPISQYGKVNAHEYFAESFTAYWSNDETRAALKALDHHGFQMVEDVLRLRKIGLKS